MQEVGGEVIGGANLRMGSLYLSVLQVCPPTVHENNRETCALLVWGFLEK